MRKLDVLVLELTAVIMVHALALHRNVIVIEDGKAMVAMYPIVQEFQIVTIKDTVMETSALHAVQTAPMEQWALAVIFLVFMAKNSPRSRPFVNVIHVSKA